MTVGNLTYFCPLLYYVNLKLHSLVLLLILTYLPLLKFFLVILCISYNVCIYTYIISMTNSSGSQNKYPLDSH